MTLVSKVELSNFLKDKTKPNWSRLNSGIDGFCVLKIPGEGDTSSLVMEIVLDTEGCKSKKRGLLIKSKSEYDLLAKIVTPEAKSKLQEVLDTQA